MTRIVSIIGAVLFSGAIGQASPATISQASPAAELARLMMPEDNYKASMRATSAQMKQLFDAMDRTEPKKPGRACPYDDPLEMLEEAKTMFSYQEFLDMQAAALAKNYTGAELKELLAFYRSPVGQKTIRVRPQLDADVSGQMRAIMQQRLPPVLEKVKARLDQCNGKNNSSSP